jgi:ABC-type transporter Mla subunit MlaD
MPETPPSSSGPDYTAILTEIKNTLVTIADKLQTLNDKEQARNDKLDTQLTHLSNMVTAWGTHNNTLSRIQADTQASANNLYVIIREIEEQNDWMRYSHDIGNKTLKATMPADTYANIQAEQSTVARPADAPNPTNMNV